MTEQDAISKADRKTRETGESYLVVARTDHPYFAGRYVDAYIVRRGVKR